MPDYRETVEKLEKAHKELCEAVQRQWNRGHALNLSIPARPDRDTDLIIGEALRESLALLREQDAELTRLAALHEETVVRLKQSICVLGEQVNKDGAELATLRAENAELLLSLGRIHIGARRALSFGKQATPQTPERMIERRDEMLTQIIGACEDAGVKPPSILRAQETL